MVSSFEFKLELMPQMQKLGLFRDLSRSEVGDDRLEDADYYSGKADHRVVLQSLDRVQLAVDDHRHL